MTTWAISDLGEYKGFHGNRYALVDETGREWMWGTHDEMTNFKQLAEAIPQFRRIAYEAAKNYCLCGHSGICNGCKVRSGGEPPSE